MKSILSVFLLLTAALAGAAEQAGPFFKAIEFAQQRTVKIYGAGVSTTIAGYASGLIVSDDGQILTAQGVYLSGQNIRIVLPSGAKHLAKIVRQDRGLQLALLKIDAKTPDYFALSDEPVVQRGDWVLAVSNAFKVADGREWLSVNVGIVGARAKLPVKRGVQTIRYDGDMILFDAITSNPGAPGGALVSAEGKLAGMLGRIVEAKTAGTRLNYAVPHDLLAKFMRGETTVAIVPKDDAKAYLGIRLFALGGRRAPAFVDAVANGSPAAKAGIRADDLVISIDGQAIRDARDYAKKLDALKVGKPVTIIVKRRGKLMPIQITPIAEKSP